MGGEEDAGVVHEIDGCCGGFVVSGFGVRQAATEALTKLDTPPADKLLAAIKTSKGIARHGAIVALGGCDDPRGRDALLALLKDSDASIRGFAVEALAANPDDDIRSQVEALETDENEPFVLGQIARFKVITREKSVE